VRTQTGREGSGRRRRKEGRKDRGKRKEKCSRKEKGQRSKSKEREDLPGRTRGAKEVESTKLHGPAERHKGSAVERAAKKPNDLSVGVPPTNARSASRKQKDRGEQDAKSNVEKRIPEKKRIKRG